MIQNHVVEWDVWTTCYNVFIKLVFAVYLFLLIFDAKIILSFYDNLTQSIPVFLKYSTKKLMKSFT